MSIEALWSRLRNEHADDPDLALGHAALVARHDRGRSAEILRASIALLPESAALWTELGRVAPEPSEQLAALQKARALGSTQPNLLVWIGRLAADAGRSDEVYEIGHELMARANQTRATIQPPIAWTDTGRAAWTRIRSALEDAPDREQLFALGQYANDLHWRTPFLASSRPSKGS